MADPSLSEALAEARASCPSRVTELHTLELRHPAFAVEGGGGAVRVVRNHPDQKTWLGLGGAQVQAVLDGLDDQTRSRVGLVARLEADAPVDPGAMVAWIAIAFELVLPEVSSSPVPQLTLTLDNVGRELMDKIEAAVETQESITVAYRPYLSTDISGPQMDPPLELTLSSVNCTPTSVVARAQMANLVGRSFPRRTYRAKDWPGLVT